MVIICLQDVHCDSMSVEVQGTPSAHSPLCHHPQPGALAAPGQPQFLLPGCLGDGSWHRKLCCYHNTCGFCYRTPAAAFKTTKLVSLRQRGLWYDVNIPSYSSS